MSEKSIVEPLSGTEVIDAMAYKLKEQLKRDCFLSANMAYESFEATIYVALKLKDIGHQPEVVKTIKVNGGAPIPASFKDPAEAALVHEERSEDGFSGEPANDVRVETGQPVPVLVENSDGKKEIKRVHYQRAKPARTDPNPAGGGASDEDLPPADE